MNQNGMKDSPDHFAIRKYLRPLLLTALIGLTACGGPAADADQSSESPDLFRVTPSEPVEILRQRALQASPPREPGPFESPDLIDLAVLDGNFQFDIRYASDYNFLGMPVYEQPRALLQRPAAFALLEAAREFAEDGLGFLIFDAYRPWFVTRLFWDATPEHLRDYVADPATGSRHNRGCAVDLTLYYLETGVPIPMPSDYDDFSPRAHIDYAGGTEEERRNRDRLRNVMEANGFEVLLSEWWHFDYKDWERYPVLNVPFSNVD